MEKNCLTCNNFECRWKNGMVSCTSYIDDHPVRKCKWYFNSTDMEYRAEKFAVNECKSCSEERCIVAKQCREQEEKKALYKKIATEQEEITRKELTDQVCDLLITALNEGLLETNDIGKLNMWMREQLGKEIDFPANEQNDNN